MPTFEQVTADKKRLKRIFRKAGVRNISFVAQRVILDVPAVCGTPPSYYQGPDQAIVLELIPTVKPTTDKQAFLIWRQFGDDNIHRAIAGHVPEEGEHRLWVFSGKKGDRFIYATHQSLDFA